MRSAAEAGADAIGLNFYPGSKRYLRPEVAEEVAAAIPAGVLKVGVFVNAKPKFLCREVDRLGLDLIQLSGDETPEYVAGLRGAPVMKTFRPYPESNAPLFDSILLQRFCVPRGIREGRMHAESGSFRRGRAGRVWRHGRVG